MLPINQRIEFVLYGVVQGIGLRPKLFQLAQQFQLTGYCQNTEQSVQLVWQGESSKLQPALNTLKDFLAPFGDLQYQQTDVAVLPNETKFNILTSEGKSEIVNLIAPDMAVCADCIAEIYDPDNRRYGYALNSCAQCGPRYTITSKIPFDRHNTSMSDFILCDRCQLEYDDPNDKRFHAQTISCPQCGPRLWLVDLHCQAIAHNQTAIRLAASALEQGKIVAVKGVGGFHLLASTQQSETIKRLRLIKNRPDKPFALMVQTIADAQDLCHLAVEEIRALQHFSKPIVIAQRNKKSSYQISDAIAPDQQRLGIMLAYTPLHHLLLHNVGSPLVATSANRPGDPIIIENSVMLAQLADLADLALLHDRNIIIPLDDSVVSIYQGKRCVIRLARGLIPCNIPTLDTQNTYIALGAQQKNHLAHYDRNQIRLSSYIGDIDNQTSFKRFESHLQQLIKSNPNATLVHDFHPLYTQNQVLDVFAQIKIPVYHHIAHIFSVIVEHNMRLPVLGFAWDGFGLGSNQQYWGCESFAVLQNATQRVATLRPLWMLGGETAFKEPRRVALAMLLQCKSQGLISNIPKNIQMLFSAQEYPVFVKLFSEQKYGFSISSMGRLFDGIALLLGCPAIISYEGQAAMYLEQLAQEFDTADTINQAYPVVIHQRKALLEIDWYHMVMAVLADLNHGKEPSLIAFRFHLWCAQTIVAIAKQYSFSAIALSGGVFQNNLLCHYVEKLLISLGYNPYFNENIPANDSNIAIGQLGYVQYLVSQKNTVREISQCV